MKNIATTLIVLAALVTTSLPQKPAGPPPPSDEDPVVKISTDLIQVDVSVTDKNGKVVPNLGQEDFEIFENGEKQNISNFAFISRTSGAAAVEVPSSHATAIRRPTLSTKPLTRGAVRRTLAIVIDDLHLSFQSVHNAREALREFIDRQMQPDDLVAIIRTGRGVGSLQQFTSDKRVLHAAVDRLRWSPTFGTFDSLASVSQNESDITERFRRESDNVASGKSKTSTVVLPGESSHDRKSSDSARNAGSQQAGVYAQSSLGAIRYVLSGMSSLPGRKAMLLFSDGIDISDTSTKSRASSVFDYLQDVTELANRSSVVVYTFDTKGMRSMSITASDSTYEIIDGHRGAKENTRRDIFRNSQDGLVYFADQTGGRAFLNSDNFNLGIERALNEQAGYYLLAYVPTAESFDPDKRRFNRLEIKVKRPGLNVSHRSGFFNVAGDTATVNQTPERRLANVLMSPFTENEIALNMSALFADDKADGPYIRSLLHIDARNLTFQDESGWKRSTFDVVAAAFGDNGVPVETKESEYTIKARGATYQAMLERGFIYVLPLPLKKPGVYQVRVAVRDKQTGKIGSAFQIVEVPDLSKKNLSLSGLAVENLSFETWRNIAAGRIGNGPGQTQVPSTLLYDTILRRFAPGSILRYGYEIYDGPKQAAPMREVEVRASIYRDNTAVVNGKLNRVDVSKHKDPWRLAITGALTLPESLEPGDYVFQLTVLDRAGNRSANQILPFEVVK